MKQLWNRFFFDFSLPHSKVVAFRFALFSILAVDAWFQIRHAPRYGAGGFNVAHFSWMESLLPMPSRITQLVAYVLQAYLAVRIALGWGTKWAIGSLAVLYAYTYFVSQLDSYQHHYLTLLVIVLCGFVQWEKPPKNNTDNHVSWALRLLLVQIAIVYGWAAISKLTPLWLDGTSLQLQIHPYGQSANATWLSNLIQTTFGEATTHSTGGFAVAAKLIAVVEFVLPVALLIRKLWPLAWVLGIGFHISIEAAGFQIGVFSYMMFAIYILITPPVLWKLLVSLAHGLRLWCIPLVRSWRSFSEQIIGRISLWRWCKLAQMCAAGVLALPLLLLPFSQAIWCAGLITAFGVTNLIGIGRKQRFAALAGHFLACITLLVMHWSTNAVHDYYKFWGGTARRLGNTADQWKAYTKLVSVSPNFGPGHYHLGRLYHQEAPRSHPNVSRRERYLHLAKKHYRVSQRLHPEDDRAYSAEALIHEHQQDLLRAQELANRALNVNPNNRIARKLLQRLEN